MRLLILGGTEFVQLGGVAPQRPDRPVVGLAPEKEARALGRRSPEV
ncbi:hypothetical protein [Streptomyces flavidovirens]|nr:hypothetical protein [Streptomyces flavidovirens]